MPDDAAEVGTRPALSPLAVPLPQLAQLLSKLSAQPITVAMLTSDVDNGAPTNSDGTLNLIQYAAWLVQQRGQGDSP